MIMEKAVDPIFSGVYSFCGMDFVEGEMFALMEYKGKHYHIPFDVVVSVSKRQNLDTLHVVYGHAKVAIEMDYVKFPSGASHRYVSKIEILALPIQFPPMHYVALVGILASLAIIAFTKTVVKLYVIQCNIAVIDNSDNDREMATRIWP